MKGSALSLAWGSTEIRPDDWRDRAACLGMSELMFDVDRTSDALDVCRECEVVEECRDDVMSDPFLRRAYASKDISAVVGGMAPSELRKRRKR